MIEYHFKQLAIETRATTAVQDTEAVHEKLAEQAKVTADKVLKAMSDEDCKKMCPTKSDLQGGKPMGVASDTCEKVLNGKIPENKLFKRCASVCRATPAWQTACFDCSGVCLDSAAIAKVKSSILAKKAGPGGMKKLCDEAYANQVADRKRGLKQKTLDACASWCKDQEPWTSECEKA